MKPGASWMENAVSVMQAETLSVEISTAKRDIGDIQEAMKEHLMWMTGLSATLEQPKGNEEKMASGILNLKNEMNTKLDTIGDIQETLKNQVYIKLDKRVKESEASTRKTIAEGFNSLQESVMQGAKSNSAVVEASLSSLTERLDNNEKAIIMMVAQAEHVAALRRDVARLSAALPA